MGVRGTAPGLCRSAEGKHTARRLILGLAAALVARPALAQQPGTTEWLRMQGERERALNEENARLRMERRDEQTRREQEQRRLYERQQQDERARDWNRLHLDRLPPRSEAPPSNTIKPCGPECIARS